MSEITPWHAGHVVAPGITYSFEGHHFQCFSRELVVLLPASVLFSQKLIPLLDVEHQLDQAVQVHWWLMLIAPFYQVHPSKPL